MTLVNFPDIPSHPDNLTTIGNNGYSALVPLGPGLTTLAAGQYWYGSYIRLVFGNDYTLTNRFENYGIIYNHGSDTISALGAANIGFEYNAGIIVAQSTAGNAYGSGSDSRINGFYNSGQIYAFSGKYNATAFGDFDPNAFVDNAGLLAAHTDATDAGTGSGIGIAQYNGGGLLNERTGTILAEGPNSRGILVGRGALNANSVYQVINLGKITSVTPTSGLPAYGIDANGLGVEQMRIFNDGTITADIAYYTQVPYANNAGADQIFVNGLNGVLNGAVSLPAGNDLIVNAGKITGKVQFGVGNSIYFSAGGTNGGSITGGTGNNSLFGSSASDTIIGGSGNDVIAGGGDGDMLAGGGGANRFVYLSINDSTVAAPDTITDFKSGTDTIDLTALGLTAVSISGGGGSYRVSGAGAAGAFAINVLGTLAPSDILLAAPAASQAGTSANDVLIAPTGGGTLTGGAGNDVLIGQDGNDVMDGGLGNNVLYGGGGLNTAVFNGNYADFFIAANNDGSVTVADRYLYSQEGTSVLFNIQKLQFNDRTLFTQQFSSGVAQLIGNFAVGAGDWKSETLYPRHLADVNGDGYADIVGFGKAGTLVSYGSTGGTYSTPALALVDFGQAQGWSNDRAFHRTLADVNGDGRADVIGFGAAGTLVSLARADGTFDNPFLAVSNFGLAQGWGDNDKTPRAMGDVNGDGRADIVGFGQAGVYVALAKGDGTFQAPRLTISNFGVAQGWSSDDAFHRALADVNGDGNADLVGFGQAGVLVALSNGDGTFADPKLLLTNFVGAQGWTSNDNTPRLVADINHDGFADIVGFGTTGTLVSYGKVDGTFTDPALGVANFSQAQGWTSDAIFHRELVDINHDGQLDIVGFGQTGVLASVYLGSSVI